MASNAKFASIAALSGDPARAAMLHALMDGRALTASELAQVGGVTPQTASGHLARLADGGLISAIKQGRHRYHRLASGTVAEMMESIMRVAADLDAIKPPIVTGPKDAALRAGRTCYDHLAGRIGVAIADALVDGDYAELTEETGMLTERGRILLRDLGVDIASAEAPAKRTKKVFCRPCLDWSERRPHLAGRLGAAICERSFDAHWVRRIDDGRAVALTRKGEQVLKEALGIQL